MKIYNKLAIVAASLVAMSSCGVHDPFADYMELGQVLPTVSWELGSSVAKAGSDVSFKGKYYTTAEGVAIDHSEVWAMVVRTESAAATQKLVSSPAYTKTVNGTDTIRSSQKIQSYPHSQAVWDGYEYILDGTFPTSRTLGPVVWSDAEVWDNEKFSMYYPATFKEEFTTQVVTYLTKDSTYYGSLRNVYIKYDFTAEQFDEINARYASTGLALPTDMSADKSKVWYTDTETVDHYYYNTIDSEGRTITHEIATEEDAPDGVSVYPVYESSPWVFCRYSDDTGGAVTAVRAEWMPLWKSLIELIPFEDWIYDTSNKSYTVNFSRKYNLVPTFKVYDTNGKVGTDTDSKSIDLN